VFVPLIPLVIVAIQKVAKRILSKYWDQYAQLGDSFLENLQGLTTLKIYEADAARHKAMNAEAEHFRIVTMKVLSMQLNSIIVMDIVALGGAVAGITVALGQLSSGALTLFGTFFIILVSSEFFVPMRQLGSYFHVAMNGLTASDKIFKLLALPEPPLRTLTPAVDDALSLHHVSFSYTPERKTIEDVSLEVPTAGITAIVGESGSGKSTIAALIAGRHLGYEGEILMGTTQVCDLDPKALMRQVTTIGTKSYLFRGSVRENLLIAKPDADDKQLWKALQQAQIDEFFRTQKGLDTLLNEDAENLSGGQRQRLALARALLHDSSIYIFDEATSSIDVESEEAIMSVIGLLAQRHAVVLISHRLANVVRADRIYVLAGGHLVESGTHKELLDSHNTYYRLWKGQSELEHYVHMGEEASNE
jgi:ATP-binding cassette subfamily B protein